MTSAADHDPTLNARHAAYLAVHNVLTRRGFAADMLATLRQEGRIAGRDAALATEIALGAIRRLITIEHVLPRVAEYEPRQADPELRALLATAAYQLIWMHRVPDFAAVNETVTIANRIIKRRGGATVNAILRRLTRALDARDAQWAPADPALIRTSWTGATRFNQAVLPLGGGFDAQLAAAAGERLERVRTLVERFGAQDAERIAWASQARPALVVHRNPLKLTQPEFHAAIQSTFPDAAMNDDTAFLPSGAGLLDSELFRTGGAYVQDTTARQAALLLAAQPDERVLDLCAAPGGKTAAIGITLQNRGEIVACDIAPQRLMQVAANVDRLGLDCVRTRLLDEDDEAVTESLGEFDAAIVDTPCSNTGVIARRPEARLGLDEQKVASLTSLQMTLLRQAAQRVRVGGRLVYSTCCLEPAENCEMIARFLANHPQWRLLTEDLSLPNWGPQASDWRDGGFAALIHRDS